MKKVQAFALGLTVLLSIFIMPKSFAQTGSYSCNVIFGDDVNHPAMGVQVDLYDNNNNFIGTTYTGEDGYFTFDDLVIGDSYIAKFSYDAEVTTVDVQDAFTLLEHLYEGLELTDLQLLAADVNGTGNINSNDFWTILLDYYINGIPFPAGDWILPDWEFEMMAGKMTGGPGQIGAIGDMKNNDPDKSNKNIRVDYNELLEINNEEIIVPISFNQEIFSNGMGIILSYNQDLVEITKIESPIKEIEYSVNNGEIRMAWASLKNTYSFAPNEAIAYIHIKQNTVLANGQIEKFKIKEGTHILDKDGKKYSTISFISSEFKLTKPTLINASFNTAYPNPCTEQFTIKIDNQKMSTADVQIYNMLGQLIKNEKITINNQKIEVQTNDLQSGMYQYMIILPDEKIKGSISIQN
jgi:hypothetical protein